jgi:hypothetical protein
MDSSVHIHVDDIIMLHMLIRCYLNRIVYLKRYIIEYHISYIVTKYLYIDIMYFCENTTEYLPKIREAKNS